MTGESVVQPAKWSIYPAPASLAYIARGLMIALLVVIGHWVNAYLGGVSTSPTVTGPGSNDTGKLFNWHPILMTLAFGVFMAEALLAYQAPIIPALSRPSRKKMHWVLHTAALLCLVLGLVAVYKSHSLKLPAPIPNLYSPHSWLGVTTVVLLIIQFTAATVCYLYPGASLPNRMALGPVHKFAGRAVWVAGMASMASGMQEKVTFIQMGKGITGEALFGGIIRLPAVAQVLIVLLAMAVLYHHVPSPQSSSSSNQGPSDLSRQGLLQPTEDP